MLWENIDHSENTAWHLFTSQEGMEATQNYQAPQEKALFDKYSKREINNGLQGPVEDKTLPAAGFLSHADPKMGG